MATYVEAVEGGLPPEKARHRLRRVITWAFGLVALTVVLRVAGIDVVSWLDSVWDTMKAIPLQYVLLGAVLKIAQTSFTAYAWYRILLYAYPESGVKFAPILTAYAVGVSLNNFVPANLGTFVMLLMFMALVPIATFPGILAGYAVQKIFYFVVTTFIYIYMFFSVSGSVDFMTGSVRDWLSDHLAVLLLVVGGIGVLVFLLARRFWPKLVRMWRKMRDGASILGNRRAYFGGVVLPEAIGYAFGIGVTCTFLAAYAIPVTFGSVMAVLGSSALANLLSFTPGGVGVNQAFNAFALDSYTDSATATAYSLGQQLITTAVNLGYALVLVVTVLGWSTGKELVRSSYEGAKAKASEARQGGGMAAAFEDEPARGEPSS